LIENWQDTQMQQMNQQASTASNMLTSQLWQQEAWWGIISKQDVLSTNT
jgi:hypothetical protein